LTKFWPCEQFSAADRESGVGRKFRTAHSVSCAESHPDHQPQWIFVAARVVNHAIKSGKPWSYALISDEYILANATLQG
jgi:hypothetical protein